MIEVTRGECPKSLKLPDPDQKTGPAVTTQTYRMEVIRRHLEGKPFPKGDSTYTDRYKQDDTKAALRCAFHDKCAYCENKQERMEVEHYRPTRKYPWLAYSWDNLLWACSSCNTKKGSAFLIKKQKAVFDAQSLANIHALATEYADSEKPVLLNPTLDNLNNLFTYDQDGAIKGNETRSFSITRNKPSVWQCAAFVPMRITLKQPSLNSGNSPSNISSAKSSSKSAVLTLQSNNGPCFTVWDITALAGTRCITRRHE